MKKPRHNPDKPQNKIGKYCPRFENNNGNYNCHMGDIESAKICKGNPHNCIKTKYVKLASRSDIRKIEDSK